MTLSYGHQENIIHTTAKAEHTRAMGEGPVAAAALPRQFFVKMESEQEAPAGHGHGQESRGTVTLDLRASYGLGG